MRSAPCCYFHPSQLAAAGTIYLFQFSTRDLNPDATATKPTSSTSANNGFEAETKQKVVGFGAWSPWICVIPPKNDRVRHGKLPLALKMRGPIRSTILPRQLLQVQFSPLATCTASCREGGAKKSNSLDGILTSS